MNYSEWLKCVFERQDDKECLFDSLTINNYLLRLCQESQNLYPKYSFEQLDKGTWFAFGVVSGYWHDAIDKNVPDEKRVNLYQSLFTYYENVFQKYCTHFYGHQDWGPEKPNPLNSSCYMFWDMDTKECPAYKGDVLLTNEIFNLLERILDIESPACQESALHGLGHLIDDHKERATSIIERYLKNEKPKTKDLEKYAKECVIGLMQ